MAETRPAAAGTQPSPEPTSQTPFDPGSARVIAGPPSDGLTAASGWIYTLACLIAIAAAVAGIGLLMHSVANCSPNPYDESLTLCDDTKTHPFFGSGLAVLIGGLVQATIVGVVGRLCAVVGGMRAAGRGSLQLTASASA